MKVGESLINKTNNVQSDSTSSSSRRRLYRKGDSCNEDQLINTVEQNCDINPVLANENEKSPTKIPVSVRPTVSESDIKSGTTGSDRNDDLAITPPEKSTELQGEESIPRILSVSVSESEQRNIVDPIIGADDPLETQAQNQSSNKEKEFLNKPQNPHDSSSRQDVDAENRRSETSSIGQLNPMSEKHSSKQVLEEILEDWPDTNKQQNDKEDDRSDLSDSEQSIHIIKKQPRKESQDRQVRSKSKKVDKPSKNTRQARANMQRVDEEVVTEEDEHLTNSISLRVRTNKQNLLAPVAKKTEEITKKKVSKKSKADPVHLNHEDEDMLDDPPDSNEMEPIVEEAPNKKVRHLRPNNQRVNIEDNKVQPSKPSRVNKRRVENEVELPTEPKVKAKKKRLVIEEDVSEANSDDEPAIEIEDIHLQRQTDDDGNKTQSSMKPKSGRPRKRKQQPDAEDTSEPSASTSKSSVTAAKKRKKQSKWDDIKLSKYDPLKPKDIGKSIKKFKKTLFPIISLSFFQALD